MFAGIDWAADEHAGCILEESGRVADRFVIAHSAEGVERLVRRLARHAPPADLPVAIERPDGRLVDRLLDAGHPLVPVKTTAIKAWREAEVGSGAKSDPGDAQVIADYLRLRRPDLRELRPFSAETRALRAVVRTRGDLVATRVAASNGARGDARRLLARRRRAVRRHLERDRARVSRALPEPGRGGHPGRRPDGGLPAQARLGRAAEPGRAL